jgi:hypothetical protein
VKLNENRKKSIRYTFEALVKYLPTKSVSYKAYEVLTKLKIYDGDYAEAKDLIERAKKLDTSSKYKKNVVGRLSKLLERYKKGNADE